MSARYDRALTSEVERSLSEGAELRFLIADTTGLSNDPFALDIQIREGNKLMYYHGTTRLLTLTFPKKAKGFPMKVKAHAARAYQKYPECGKQYDVLIKDWLLTDIAAFKQAWQAYLKAALQGAKGGYYSNQKEGYWQNRLCIDFGTRWTPDREWLVIDRECVIGFDSTLEKVAHYDKAQAQAMKIKGELQASVPKKWGKPDKKGFGDEVDMLAIDKEGKLIVVELKFATNARGIYWGPLQTNVYYCAFKDAPPEVITGVKQLVTQKINLGLLPKEAKRRVAEASFILGNPVLAISAPNKKSGCWKKLIEVCTQTKQGQDWPLKIALLQANNGQISVNICEPEDCAR
jgi:hypothetical protein